MRWSATACRALILALVLPGSAYASEADFKLKNRTGYQIDEVYISLHASSAWGHDRMGRDALEDGGMVDIPFPHGGRACRFDIKVKYHDESSVAEWADIDLCTYESISLYWDAKRRAARAVGE